MNDHYHLSFFYTNRTEFGLLNIFSFMLKDVLYLAQIKLEKIKGGVLFSRHEAALFNKQTNPSAKSHHTVNKKYSCALSRVRNSL